MIQRYIMGKEKCFICKEGFRKGQKIVFSSLGTVVNQDGFRMMELKHSWTEREIKKSDPLLFSNLYHVKCFSEMYDCYMSLIPE